ncbi:MAG: hypothetical protein ABJF27_15135 [Crocinitomicaceae bacterium]
MKLNSTILILLSAFSAISKDSTWTLITKVPIYKGIELLPHVNNKDEALISYLDTKGIHSISILTKNEMKRSMSFKNLDRPPIIAKGSNSIIITIDTSWNKEIMEVDFKVGSILNTSPLLLDQERNEKYCSIDKGEIARIFYQENRELWLNKGLNLKPIKYNFENFIQSANFLNKDTILVLSKTESILKISLLDVQRENMLSLQKVNLSILNENVKELDDFNIKADGGIYCVWCYNKQNNETLVFLINIRSGRVAKSFKFHSKIADIAWNEKNIWLVNVTALTPNMYLDFPKENRPFLEGQVFHGRFNSDLAEF